MKTDWKPAISEEQWQANIKRRESLVRRLTEIMGWPFSTCHIFQGIRKIGHGEATVIGNDKLEQIINRLEGQNAR